MKPFNHVDAGSVQETTELLSGGTASVIAGGTDLIGTLKDNLLPEYPKTVVNLKTIPGMDYIKEEGGALKVGALTRLADIADNALVQEKYTALAEAAKSVATPHIRDMATLGGNIAQLPRCWYFRKGENRFNCIRKGGTECFAVTGDNRYHSAFGGAKACVTPCTSECPAGTDIPAYMACVRAGDLDGAARIVLSASPMPAVTSRVCAHFCQQGCNRGKESESVAISSVERVLGDFMLDNAAKYYPAPEKETGKSVAIVGSGPAGLAAAYYLRRAGNRVTVIDAKDEPGGMLMYAIPAFRLPKDVVRKYIKAFEGMGIVFQTNTRIGVDVTPETLEKGYDSVLYATGAWKRPVLGLSGEELAVFGLDFLTQVNQWMDGKVGTEVIVAGGGNVAMDVAITAKRLGAKKVTLACLEPRERMPASADEIARAEQEGVVVMPSWGLSQVVHKDGKVAGLELKRCVSPWDETGRFNPQYDENEKVVINAENILLATGQQVDVSFLDEKYQIQLTARGLINIAEDTAMTSRPGVFAGGDVTTGPATVIRSITGGRAAADGIARYLGTPRSDVYVFPGDRLTFDAQGIQNKAAIKLREVALADRKLDVEDSSTPTQGEAKDEANRCLNCGCYAVSPSDTATALVALGASIVTDQRTIPAESFFAVRQPAGTVLGPSEIITEIVIPAPEGKTTFKKMAFRKAIDFSVVNCAIVLGKSPRVCIGAVAPTPYRATGAESVLAGGAIDEARAEAAGEAAVADGAPFEDTRYKLQIAKTLVKRTLLGM